MTGHSRRRENQPDRTPGPRYLGSGVHARGNGLYIVLELHRADGPFGQMALDDRMLDKLEQYRQELNAFFQSQGRPAAEEE